MRRFAALFAATFVCASTAVFATDWAQWRGPSANGIAPDTGINKSWNTKAPKVLWKATLTDDGYAGMTVAAGKVYIIDHQGKQDIVRAIDVATGKDAWKYTYDDTDRGNFGFARSTPIVDMGKVYTLSRLGLLNCLDAKTGKLVWSRQIIDEFKSGKPNWDIAYSPVIDGNKLIVLTGGKGAGVVALDKKTGKTLWQGGQDDMFSYATPVIATINGKKQYVTFTVAGLAGVDAANGKVLWTSPWKTGSDCNAATPIVMGNSVYITSGYGHGCSLVDVGASEAKTRWESKDMKAHFSSPILYKDYIYGTGDPGFLMCIEPKTGKVMWKQEGFQKGAIVGVDGVMIAMTGKEGDLVMVELTPDSYKELGRFNPLGGESWTAPIIANGKLIVRNKTSIACIALK